MLAPHDNPPRFLLVSLSLLLVFVAPLRLEVREEGREVEGSVDLCCQLRHRNDSRGL